MAKKLPPINLALVTKESSLPQELNLFYANVNILDKRYYTQPEVDEFLGNFDSTSFSSVSFQNEVFVDPTQPEVEGICYQSISNADIYVQTQSPSSSNRWAIKVSGNNSESITVRSWVAIVGELEATRLTGSINSTGPINTSYHEYMVSNAELTNISTTGTNFLCIDNCHITASTPPGGIIVLFRCLIEGGDFSIASTCIPWNCPIITATFNENTSFHFCNFSSFGSTILYGGKLRSCHAESGSVILNSGVYELVNSSIKDDLSTNDNITLESSHFEGEITINAGSTLTTKNSYVKDVINNGGIWNNSEYKERVVSVSSISGSLIFDLSQGTVFTTTLTENISGISFSNGPESTKAFSFTWIITQDSTARTINWGSINWSGGITPTISTADAIYIVEIMSVGSTRYGFLSGSEMQ